MLNRNFSASKKTYIAKNKCILELTNEIETTAITMAGCDSKHLKFFRVKTKCEIHMPLSGEMGITGAQL